jgi:hypothetical protein
MIEVKHGGRQVGVLGFGGGKLEWGRYLWRFAVRVIT